MLGCSVYRIDSACLGVDIFLTFGDSFYTPALVIETFHHLMSIFLYGFTLSDAPHDFEDLRGVDERNLFMVTSGDVSAIVSSYAYDSLHIRGKDIFAHQQAIGVLMDQASIIPLEFGLTLKNLAAVEDVLVKNQEHLRTELHRIYRKVEMEVALRFASKDLFEYMLAKHPYLREEKGKVVNGRLLYYLGDRARKGEKFERALNQEKEIFASKIDEAIGPWCAEIARSRLIHRDHDVATFNCLVNRERLKVFERSIYDAAEVYGGDLLFTFNGPWAPQHFCNLSKIAYA